MIFFKYLYRVPGGGRYYKIKKKKENPEKSFFLKYWCFIAKTECLYYNRECVKRVPYIFFMDFFRIVIIDYKIMIYTR